MYWYHSEIEALEEKIKTQHNSSQHIFYGSSSIRLWSELNEDFPSMDCLNLGFGGSTLAGCTWFMDRIIEPLNPSSITVYAGDNDLGDGRHPEEVFISLCLLMERVNQWFPETPFSFVSIKPSLSRWYLKKSIEFSNQIIQKEINRKKSNNHFVDIYSAMLNEHQLPNPSLYAHDGLHMSRKGYLVWKEILESHFSQIIKTEETLESTSSSSLPQKSDDDETRIS